MKSSVPDLFNIQGNQTSIGMGTLAFLLLSIVIPWSMQSNLHSTSFISCGSLNPGVKHSVFIGRLFFSYFFKKISVIISSVCLSYPLLILLALFMKRTFGTLWRVGDKAVTKYTLFKLLYLLISLLVWF